MPGASLSPMLGAICLASPGWLNAPFYLAGSLKVLYDLLLYRSFSALRRRPRFQAASGRMR